MNQEKISYGKGETFKAALAFLAQQISSQLVIEIAPHWSNSPPFHGAGYGHPQNVSQKQKVKNLELTCLFLKKILWNSSRFHIYTDYSTPSIPNIDRGFSVLTLLSYGMLLLQTHKKLMQLI